MAMIAAAPVAEAAAGRAAAGTAAKRAGASKAAKAAKKPAAASGTAGVPTPPPSPAPPPSTEDMAAGLLKPPGTKQIGNVARSAGDAFSSATLTPPRRLNAKDASGFAFGLVLYAMALSGIAHGPAGVTGWLRAKFLNKPMVKPPGAK